MDARVAALESSVAALSDSIDSKMAMFFEQFRREQACARGTGGSTSDTDLPPQPLITDPPDPGDLVLIGLAITGNLASIFPDSLRVKTHLLGFKNRNSFSPTIPFLSFRRS
ncbi:hypothetical protein TB1_026127 [Malus domestica]